MPSIIEPDAGRPTTLEDLQRLSRLAPAFELLDQASLEQLAAGARVWCVRAGTRILRRGVAGRSVFWVIEGRTVAAYYAHGAARILETHEPGAFFGELAALTRTTRQTDVVATHDTTLLELPYAVLGVLLEHAGARALVISGLLQRWQRINGARLVNSVYG